MIKRIVYLVTTELKYRYLLIIAAYSVLVFIALLIGVPSHGSAYFYMVPPTRDGFMMMMWLIIIVHSFLTYQMITGERIEQRARFLLPLPVTRTEIGWARLVTVLLLHSITLSLLVLWMATLLEPNEFRFSPSIIERTSTFGLYMIIFNGIVCAIVISLCFSLFIMLLESRSKPPLLTSAQWVLFVAFILVIFYISISLPFRIRGLAFIPMRRNFELPLLTPYFTLLALFLGYWYKVRFQRLDSFKV